MTAPALPVIALSAVAVTAFAFVTAAVSAAVRSAVDDGRAAPFVPQGRAAPEGRPARLSDMWAYACYMADIVIKGKAPKTLTVDLVGVEYKARVPKAAIALVLAKDIQSAGDDPEALQTSLARWTRVLFGKETGNEVMARLRDPEDNVDIDDLAEVIKAVMEANGNPTT